MLVGRVRVPVSVHHNAVVCLVDEVCGAGDVVQVGRLPLPLAQLARVRHKPHVHARGLGAGRAAGRGDWVDAYGGQLRRGSHALRRLSHLQLARMLQRTHARPPHLRKALDLGQHLAHVLSLVHGGGALVVQLIVRVNHQAPDTWVQARVAWVRGRVREPQMEGVTLGTQAAGRCPIPSSARRQAAQPSRKPGPQGGAP